MSGPSEPSSHSDGPARNVGTLDRALRIAVGLVLLGFALACPFAAAQGPVVVWTSGIVGAVALITGALGSCPLYRALGRSTAAR